MRWHPVLVAILLSVSLHPSWYETSEHSEITCSPPTSLDTTRGDITVDPHGGGDYETIASAVENASEGDSIHVLPGTYNESIVISKSIDLIGEGADRTIMDGNGSRSVIRIEADNVNVSGLRVNHSGDIADNALILLDGVRNCRINNTELTNGEYGILLSNSADSVMAENTARSVNVGIMVSDSSDSHLIDNDCSQIRTGISLSGSSGNEIASNTCNDCADDGIYLYYSNENSIRDNTCESNDDYGIYIYKSQFNTVNSNICDQNHDDGISVYYSPWNTVLVNICDENWYSGIGISNSEGCTVEGNDCRDNDYGISVSYSDHTKVANNSCISSRGWTYGIYTDRSDNCEYFNNTCHDHRYAIYISEAVHCRISNNSFCCNDYGMRLYYSNNIIMENNICYGNYDYGLYISSSDSNVCIGNNFSCDPAHQYYEYYGIYLSSSDQNQCIGNECNDGTIGIYIGYSNVNELLDNVCNNNDYFGINSYLCSRTTVLNNTCRENDHSGINLYHGDENRLSNNRIGHNGIGIYLRYSDDNVIEENLLENNRGYDDDSGGICLNSSGGNNVSANVCLNNSRYGIRVSGTELEEIEHFNNYIYNNTCRGSDYGIYLEHAHWNNISENQCENNIRDGVKQCLSHHNNVTHNRIGRSWENGLALDRSNFNNITGNRIEENLKGIFLDNCMYNNLSRNTVHDSTVNGIELDLCTGDRIEENTLRNNLLAVLLNECSRTDISRNSMTLNRDGVVLADSEYATITNNILEHHEERSLRLLDSCENEIAYNSINDSLVYGIDLYGSTGNLIHHNDIISPFDSALLAFDDEGENDWDNGTEGNYWSNYGKVCPEAEPLGKIWDTAYHIRDEGAVDRFPLRYPISDYLSRPAAYAGRDEVIEQFETYTFDGTGSFDHLGIASYMWTFVHGGENFTLNGSMPSFVFTRMGTYEITLRITNTRGRTDEDIVFITVLDAEPPAIVLPWNIIIDQHETAAFDARNCTDNGGITGYEWSFEYEGDGHILEGPSVSFTFHRAGLYIITLQLWDARNNSARKVTNLTVRDITSPSADSGPDATIDQFQDVFLDGSGSRDNVGVTAFTWEFRYNEKNWTRHGPLMIFKFSTAGVYMVSLNATDEAGNWDIDVVNVTVRDITDPCAAAGSNRTVKVGRAAILNGSLSSDNVGIANYTWSFPYHGARMTLYGCEAEYVFLETGVYSITLTVRDEAGNSHSDVTYRFVEKRQKEEPDDDDGVIPGSGAGGDMEYLDTILCGAGIVIIIVIAVLADLIFRRIKKKKALKNGRSEEVVDGLFGTVSENLFRTRDEEEERPFEFGETDRPPATMRIVEPYRRDIYAEPKVRKIRIMRKISRVSPHTSMASEDGTPGDADMEGETGKAEEEMTDPYDTKEEGRMGPTGSVVEAGSGSNGALGKEEVEDDAATAEGGVNDTDSAESGVKDETGEVDDTVAEESGDKDETDGADLISGSKEMKDIPRAVPDNKGTPDPINNAQHHSTVSPDMSPEMVADIEGMDGEEFRRGFMEGFAEAMKRLKTEMPPGSREQ